MTSLLRTPSSRPEGATLGFLGRTLHGLVLLGGLNLAAFLHAEALLTDNVVVKWDEAVLQAIRDTKPGPTVVARALAVVHTAIFDSWAAYDARAVGTRLGARLRRPAGEFTEANKNEAVSYAAYRAALDLFPTRQPLFDGLMASLGYDPANLSTDQTKPAGIGNVAARAVLDFRHQDGSNQLGNLHAGAYSDYTGYTPVNSVDQLVDPARWQPLRIPNGQGGFTVQTFTTPHWNRVTPFSLRYAAEFRPERPAGADTQAFKDQAREIILYSALLTDTQKVIAEYWADGPNSEFPPGHWMLFAQFVSRRDHHTVDDDAKLFFALGNAMLDASIVCWDAKRYYDCARPITTIRHLFAGQQIQAWGGPGQGTRTIDGKDWQPYQAANVVTPPFPEYTSGHSLFSSAGATILRLFTGNNIFGASATVPAGSSKVEPGLVPATDVTLSWATFTDAADEAGLSRRYGGIHFVEADLISRELGLEVAAQVWRRASIYFYGPTEKAQVANLWHRPDGNELFGHR